MRMRLASTIMPTLLLGVAVALPAGGAAAAPQVLALVANGEPVAMTCFGRECWAEVSAFCLEPERRSPVEGTVYRMHDPRDIRLVGTLKDGRQVELDPETHLSITALRTHVAVRISMPHRALGELGLTRVAVAVAENASLLPAPAPGDPAAHGSTELELATGVLRDLGKRIVDQDRDRMVTARIANRMINALPPNERVPAEVRNRLWQATVKAETFRDAAPGADSRAQAVYDLCNYGAAYGLHPSMRACLQSQHDSVVGSLNNEYWDAVKAGF